jgi:hypothetical protein
VPEARDYLSTTSLNNARERGTLSDLKRIFEGAARTGHPAGATVAISAYLRHRQGESVTEALDRLDDEAFTDDAGHSIVIAYWAAIGELDLADSAQRLAAPACVVEGTRLRSHQL